MGTPLDTLAESASAPCSNRSSINCAKDSTRAKATQKCFFAFADTVATRSFQTGGKGRSWLGIRFQTRPREEPSEIIIHAHLLDSTATGEQAALGILGVNLIYA